MTVNRQAYNQKFAAAEELLGTTLDFTTPDAAFYLWPDIGGDDIAFCQALFAETHVTAVPGQYFARTVRGANPGAGRVRLSLVADLEQTTEALHRFAKFCESYFARS